jgi:hypothetical protein
VTHARAAAHDQSLARAREAADHAIDIAGAPGTDDRAIALAVITTDLLARFGLDGAIAAAAELALRTVERTPAPDDPGAPIDLVPDAGIRLASDYPGFGG